MVLALAIGDIGVPLGSQGIPQKLKELLQPGKIHQVICTGNLCDEATMDFLKTVSSNIIIVQGDLDAKRTYPIEKVVQIGEFHVGVCHGHHIIPPHDRDAISAVQRRLGVDILIKGCFDPSKGFESYVHREGEIVVQPGSASGWQPWSDAQDSACRPSFALMDIKGKRAVVYVYTLDINNEVQVEKIEFTKP
ncbi:Vacuolar protein sorting-associated protein 29 [Picochlorum sp. SENEW3]|nr:Vacuolar protein sorting-associated protein 29 [Picochlorum sp. SENEW3]